MLQPITVTAIGTQMVNTMILSRVSISTAVGAATKNTAALKRNTVWLKKNKNAVLEGVFPFLNLFFKKMKKKQYQDF